MNRTPRHTIAVLLVAGNTGDLVVAATIRVPEDYKTIQAAVDQASAGDTVLVAAGIQPTDKLIAVGNRFFSEHDRTGVVVTGGEAIVADNRIVAPEESTACEPSRP